MKALILYVAGLLISMGCYAQENAHLRKLTEGVVQLRKAKASKDMLNKTVALWSASGSPKITLMDDLERDAPHEFTGKEANKFKINQVVTYVYSRQNTGMVSKGDYFNSTEKDVYYSAIEKNVKKAQTATYTLRNHVGSQEFVFISFNPKTNFTAMVNGKKATDKGNGIQVFKLDREKMQEKIVFSITNHSGNNESFVILNYNPQK